MTKRETKADLAQKLEETEEENAYLKDLLLDAQREALAWAARCAEVEELARAYKKMAEINP